LKTKSKLHQTCDLFEFNFIHLKKGNTAKEHINNIIKWVESTFRRGSIQVTFRALIFNTLFYFFCGNMFVSD
jgi:hypothetical protein